MQSEQRSPNHSGLSELDGNNSSCSSILSLLAFLMPWLPAGSGKQKCFQSVNIASNTERTGGARGPWRNRCLIELHIHGSLRAADQMHVHTGHDGESLTAAPYHWRCTTRPVYDTKCLACIPRTRLYLLSTSSRFSRFTLQHRIFFSKQGITVVFYILSCTTGFLPMLDGCCGCSGRNVFSFGLTCENWYFLRSTSAVWTPNDL